MVRIECGLDQQSGAGRCMGNQADDGLVTHQGLATPVLRGEAEQAMAVFTLAILARRLGGPLAGPSWDYHRLQSESPV